MADLPAEVDWESSKTLQTMHQTVAKGCTKEQFQLFCQFARATGLNPFKKEVWAIPVRGSVQIMTGINGYLRIANANPAFDGMKTELLMEKEKVVGAKCTVWRKDRTHPHECEVYMAEYYKANSPIWKQMPRVMIQKVAKSVALREAFSQELGGTYTVEEMPREFSPPKEVAVEKLENETGNVEMLGWYWKIQWKSYPDKNSHWANVEVIDTVTEEELYDETFASKSEATKWLKETIHETIKESKNGKQEDANPQV